MDAARETITNLKKEVYKGNATLKRELESRERSDAAIISKLHVSEAIIARLSDQLKDVKQHSENTSVKLVAVTRELDNLRAGSLDNFVPPFMPLEPASSGAFDTAKESADAAPTQGSDEFDEFLSLIGHPEPAFLKALENEEGGVEESADAAPGLGADMFPFLVPIEGHDACAWGDGAAEDEAEEGGVKPGKRQRIGIIAGKPSFFALRGGRSGVTGSLASLPCQKNSPKN